MLCAGTRANEVELQRVARVGRQGVGQVGRQPLRFAAHQALDNVKAEAANMGQRVVLERVRESDHIVIEHIDLAE